MKKYQNILIKLTQECKFNNVIEITKKLYYHVKKYKNIKIKICIWPTKACVKLLLLLYGERQVY